MATHVETVREIHVGDEPRGPQGYKVARPSPRKRFIGRDILDGVASLKVTVVLMGLAIFLVFAGTLAQVSIDMWEVIDQYFSAYVAWINLQVFFPPSFFPHLHARIPAVYFPFPGGATIGLAMIINLLAAHALRFKVYARGWQLALGLVVVAIGCLVTWMVIDAGHNKEGFQGEPFFEWSTFWIAIKWLLGIGALGLTVPLVRLTWYAQTPRYFEAAVVAATQVGLVTLLAWLTSANASLSPSSLRILWQVLQGTAAGLVLLPGAWLLFRRRAGIVLIHGGILLMMLGQYIATVYNVEERMAIREGQTAHFAEDIRTTELAIIDPSDPKEDIVVVIPREILLNSYQHKHKITDDRLPFDVEVLDYYKNADLVRRDGSSSSPADQGLGRDYVIKPTRPSAGASSDQTVDLAAAYVRLIDKKSNKPLGTYLVSVLAALGGHRDAVAIDGKVYEIALRFRRSYKPYSVTLIDVVRENYSGTNTPRDYSSIIRLVDPSRNVDRQVRIWMNNPLRYAGETFYQSRYDDGSNSGGIELTELQVVKNTGWMIPYVACMIVMVGMAAHFWGTLLRFLVRREEALFVAGHTERPQELAPSAAAGHRRRTNKARSGTEPAARRESAWKTVFPWAVVAAGTWWLLWPAYTALRRPGESMDVKAFGELPVRYEGRLKPMDTVARTTLKALSNRESVKDAQGKTQPAIRWFLDVISGSAEAGNYHVVRIDNAEVLDLFGLRPRPGMRYALSELAPKLHSFEEQVMKIAPRLRDKEQLSTFERKVMELDSRLRTFLTVKRGFWLPELPDHIPTAEQIRSNDPKAMDAARLIAAAVNDLPNSQELEAIGSPQAVPIATDGRTKWQPLAAVYTDGYLAQLRSAFMKTGQPASLNAGAAAMHRMLQAYREGNAVRFNEELRAFQRYLADVAPSDYHPRKIWFEAFYNRYAPFFHAQWAYFAALILSLVAFLGWSRPLNRAAFWLMVVTLLVHTFALVARMYISGRPPVTTLYSSAIFIGWAAVITGLVIEFLYRLGIGNLIASMTGLATLIIAAFLATGDTMPVLQAVLDTQFWLSTHVVFITLGYSATFAAGALALVYLLDRAWLRRWDEESARAVVRMIYGTVCFALLFSFVGTVWGGLWADDSWGRFWGWDPKENGALMIVLWNAIILHARWDGMVRDRGLALLAIGGNIITSWSWFGVNELGAGLHSYGFTEGVLLALGLFVLSQLALIVIGCLLPASRFYPPGTRSLG